MKRITDRIARQFDGDSESGVTMILMALLMVVMMGAAAMAVDLGWLYLNSIRTQQAADAAALAGVVYMPDEFPTASSVAIATATANEYINGVNATVTPAKVPGSLHQLQVTVDNSVPTFFMQVFGINNVSLSREAVAEYVLPLPLGSPEPTFGNEPETGENNFWGNIHGYYTGRKMGDRYSSQCLHNGAGSGCTKNDERRETVYTPGDEQNASGGYVYGVELAAGASDLSLEIFDGPFTRGGGDLILTGDNPQGGDPGPTTVFILYGPDPTPLNTSDNEVLCTMRFEARDPYADFNGDGSTWYDVANPWATSQDDQDHDGDLDWDDVEIAYPGGVVALWDEMCPGTVLDRGPGIYPLRVLIENGNRRGLNRWSLRASTSGPTAAVYGLGDMAVYSNVDGTAGNTEFYLAEVDEIHAGKSLIIELWDPGDASGNHSLRIVDPSGSWPACEWTSDNPSYPGGSLSHCDIPTSSGRFDDHLVTIRVEIPSSYTCGSDCWWSIDYNYVGVTQDTTTWAAHIAGNPVRLIS